MPKVSKLVRMTVRNIGCIGIEPLEILLDDIVCLVGKNNAGKSTVLRAYEWARNACKLPVGARNQAASADDPSEVILDVHIPPGIGNIGEEWKFDQDGLRILRSRWHWKEENVAPVRTTWRPNGAGGGAWAEDKAGGFDNVFKSRLPVPVRIDSLDDLATKTQDALVALALEPLFNEVERRQADPESALSTALRSLLTSIADPIDECREKIGEVTKKVNATFSAIFPGLAVDIEVQAAPFAMKAKDLIAQGSGIKICEGESGIEPHRQGTGARRALFWALMQVRHELEVQKAPVKKTKAKGKEAAEAPETADDFALPGYILLIDEPENALHPSAARAAQRQLYELASSDNWQVMLTTHSPFFINPLEDHTTIVRLEREVADGSLVTPRTYRAEAVSFEGSEREQLQALLQMDTTFTEMFFGACPIFVEGDTERAAFLAVVAEGENLLDKIVVVPARGKALLAPLAKVARHFKVGFGIVHDADTPFRKDGARNGMWTENEKIRAQIDAARAEGCTVAHKVSVLDFERFLGGDELGKDKPFSAYARIKGAPELQAQVRELFEALRPEDNRDPTFAKEGVPYIAALKAAVMAWAKVEGVDGDLRFSGKQ